MHNRNTNNSNNINVNSTQNSNSNYPYKCQNITVSVNKQTSSSNKKNERDLKILVWNANGLQYKIRELKLLLSDQCPDVVAICEIKMSETSANLLYDINGYFPFHKIRDENGGGVALLIRVDSISKH